jgi:hypothetical protein
MLNCHKAGIIKKKSDKVKLAIHPPGRKRFENNPLTSERQRLMEEYSLDETAI